MIERIHAKAAALINQYNVICLFLAVMILTLTGVGVSRTVNLIGLILCAIALEQGAVRIDLRVLVPLIVFNVICAISTFLTYGNLYRGFAAEQMVLLVIYLLTAYLEGKQIQCLRRMLAVWAGVIAAVGIWWFAYGAVVRKTARLGAMLGGPNIMGIFLVVAWFHLMNCGQDDGADGHKMRWLRNTEPLLLAALALTLSMGSFISMAAGLLVMLVHGLRRQGLRATLIVAVRTLARVSFGMGTGMLIYLAASRTGVPWLSLLILPYLAAVAVLWRRYERFLEEYPLMSFGIAAAGILIAGMAVLLRPNAVATFAERLAMMKNALGYMTVNPLWGVGPNQWSRLNMADGDQYFGTYHIHNILLHIGVEVGWIALLMLVLVVVRYFRKKNAPLQQAGLVAFGFHSMIDTSFFFPGVVAMLLITMSNPGRDGTKVRAVLPRLIFGACAAVFGYNLYCCMG